MIFVITMMVTLKVVNYPSKRIVAKNLDVKLLLDKNKITKIRYRAFKWYDSMFKVPTLPSTGRSVPAHSYSSTAFGSFDSQSVGAFVDEGKPPPGPGFWT